MKALPGTLTQQCRGNEKDLAVGTWLNQAHTDFAFLDGDGFYGMTRDIKALKHGEWDRFPPQNLNEFLHDPGSNVMARFGNATPSNGEINYTCAFKTGAGQFGLLQITGFSDNPHGVQIRYKLVQMPAVIIRTPPLAEDAPQPIYLRDEKVALPPKYEQGAEVPLPPAYQRGQNPVSGPAVAQADDLKARIAAAAGIAGFPKRDEVLAAIARDAARAGDFEDARDALQKVTAFPKRDEAIYASARLLVVAGKRADALELAKLVTAFPTRDALISELTK